MTTIAELMRANLLDVFNERNHERRLAAIERTYTEDVVFHDPEGALTGRPAIDEKVSELLGGVPDFVFRPGGPVLESYELGQLAWEFGPAGQSPVVTGIDIGLVRDGRLATVHTILTSGPDAG